MFRIIREEVQRMIGRDGGKFILYCSPYIAEQFSKELLKDAEDSGLTTIDTGTIDVDTENRKIHFEKIVFSFRAELEIKPELENGYKIVKCSQESQ